MNTQTQSRSEASPERGLRHPRFIILSEPRTGSNNISYVLAAHPALECANELFHPKNGIMPGDIPCLDHPPEVRAADDYHWISRLPFDDRKSIYAKLFESHNGFKIHSQHLPPHILVEIVREMDCLVLLAVRRNLFEQAISNFIATYSGRWHADEKKNSVAQTPIGFSIPPARFIDWIEQNLRIRRNLWAALSDEAARVVVCEYETFFSGSSEQRLMKFHAVFDRLGVPRFGQLPEHQRAETFKRSIHFIDPAKQKMTPVSDARASVENYEELEHRFALWRMGAFALIL